MAQSLFEIEQETEVDRHLSVFIGKRTHVLIGVDFMQQLSSESHRGIVLLLIKEGD